MTNDINVEASRQFGIVIAELQDDPETRGSSFNVPAPVLPDNFAMRDIHVTTIVRGGVRGNHYHLAKREVFLITYQGAWSFIWDNGQPDGDISVRRFAGQGIVAIFVPTGISHAIRNDDADLVQIVGISDMPYTPAEPDAYARRVSDD